MAFQSGSQVNPALGRTDFTPFLQGAMQGAQAQARGAENIAQGLAGLGQQVASGIEKYYKKEEEKKVRKEGIDFIVRNFNVDEKAAAAGLSALGPQIIPFLQGEKERQRVEQSSQYAGLLEQSGGAPVSLESGPISSVAQQQGRKMYLDNLYTQSQIAKNLSEVNKPTAGEVMSMDEIENLKRGGNDVKAVPVGGGMFRVESVSPFAPLAKTYPTTDEILSAESGKQAIVSGSEYVKGAKQNYADSSAQFETASAINNVLRNPKITTGFLAKASGTFRNLAESLFGGDFNAAESEIYKKGVSAFGLAGVRALFRSLGAMSDGDRQRGESTQMSITDPKKSIEYYTEVAKLNQERAREDVNTINKLQRQGVNADEIQRQIEELKMNRPSISDQAYETVFGQPNSEATNTPKPNQAAINYLQQNPNARAAFDAKYGAGAAKQVLGN